MNKPNPDTLKDRIARAIDWGGGQTCDVAGVIRELAKAGFVIIPREPTEKMMKAGLINYLGQEREMGQFRTPFNGRTLWQSMINAEFGED